MEVNDLRTGLNQIIQEVRTGLVPPVGGRVIVVRGTGEPAFVGFGSIVVRSSENSAVQAKLNLESQKIAAMRAKDSLCGLIIGDKTAWKGSVVEKHKDEVQEFEVLRADDPLAKDTPAGVKKLDKARQTFESTLRTEDVFTSARKGALPPGITTRTWFDEDHAWAFAMSVYLPSLSKAAGDAAREALENPKEGGPGNKSGSGFKDEKNPDVKRPSGTIKPGPSGKTEKDEDK